MTDLEYIDLYFQGSHPPEEKQRFEKRLLEDPAFAEEVAFYLSVEKLALEQAREEKKRHFRQLYRQNGAGTPPAIVRPMRKAWYYSAAAVLIGVLAGAYFLLRSPDEQRLAEQYIKSNLDKLSVSMSNREDMLQTGLHFYNDGQYAAAARIFEQILHADPSNYAARKYAGIAYLRLNDCDKALMYFGQLENQTGRYANPAKLYQALTYMKRCQPGDREKARELLQQVVDQRLEGKQTAAQWLRKL